MVLVEGQGSINHPGYSGVTLGLLHGSCPDAMILCHQPTREYLGDYRTASWVKIPPLSEYVRLYEAVGSVVHPTRVIGIALNTFDLDEPAARTACEAAAEETGLPATDPVRFDPKPLVDAMCKAARRREARVSRRLSSLVSRLRVPMPLITPAHLHVLINHIPIIGVPIIALFLLWGLARRDEPVVRAALIGTVLIAICTYITVLTGDGAKDDVLTRSWVNKELVEAHEAAGDWANYAGIVIGVAALGTLFLARKGRPVPRAAAFGVFCLMLVATAILARASWEGGKIRHDEFKTMPVGKG